MRPRRGRYYIEGLIGNERRVLADRLLTSGAAEGRK